METAFIDTTVISYNCVTQQGISSLSDDYSYSIEMLNRGNGALEMPILWASELK